MYETELKSNFTLFLKEFLELRNITFDDFLKNLYEYSNLEKRLVKINSDFFELLKKEWKKQVESYNIQISEYSIQYYLLVKVLSFGTVVKILDLNYN